MALAGVVATSCTQEHIDAQYIPGNAVAPTLGEISGGVLESTGADLNVEYTKAEFGVNTAHAHTLYISTTEDMAKMKKVKASFGDNKIAITQADLNIVALDFVEADTEAEFFFQIIANLNTDKGAAVESTNLYSNIVKATFTTYNADVLPTEKFAYVWVIGDYCGWSHDKTQFLFDYKANDKTFSGVIDFADAEGNSLAANGFKLTGIAGWDDTCNWGEEKEAESADEASSVQLITGGGSANIKRFAKRFYGFEFDKSSLVLKKNWGADQIGIIGLNGDWSNDIVMEYNAKWTRFYADIEVADDCSMKFRADAAWDLNWGAAAFGLEGDADGNIVVAAGKYRVYFNPEAGLLEFSANKFGTEEDLTFETTEPEEDENEEASTAEAGKFGLIGVNGDWAKDIYMYAVDGGLYYSPVVTMEGEFKIRYNNNWDVERCGTFANVGEPFEVKQGGDNIKVPSGTYVVAYDSVAETVTIIDATKGWGIIGDALANGWASDTYYAFEGEDGVFTAVAYVTEKGFKFRKNANWDEANYGGTFVKFGEAFKAENGGGNISIAEALGEAAGAWVTITLDTTAETITINNLFTGRWSVIGDINGTAWNSDVLMWFDGTVWKSAPFIANGGFKLRKDGDWAENFGGTFAEFDAAFKAEAGGSNIDAGKDKQVTVVYNPTDATITVSEFK